jgi:hypothetical protein
MHNSSVFLPSLLQEAGITELLMAPGQMAGQLPGCSGTRNLGDNLSDLKAQVCWGRGGLEGVCVCLGGPAGCCAAQT